MRRFLRDLLTKQSPGWTTARIILGLILGWMLSFIPRVLTSG